MPAGAHTVRQCVGESVPVTPQSSLAAVLCRLNACGALGGSHARGCTYVLWGRCLMSPASACWRDINSCMLYVFKNCLRHALLANDRNYLTCLHQGRLITVPGERADSSSWGPPHGTLEHSFLVVILQNRFIESESQLYKRKYAWKRNLPMVYF